MEFLSADLGAAEPVWERFVASEKAKDVGGLGGLPTAMIAPPTGTMKFLSVDTISTGVALQEWCLLAVKPMWFSRIKAGKVPARIFSGVR